MQFIANLRDRTIEAFGRHGIQPDAYLLSTHRITPAALAHAHALRDDGIPIMADNGSKALIDDVLDAFRDRGRAVWHQVRDLRHAVGRTPRGGDIPPALRDEASGLAREVVERATALSEAVDGAALLDAQLSMRPTHLIAQEDFAVGCLLALNLERETTGWRIAAYDARNRRSLRLWRRVADDPRVQDIVVYAVLSAADYNTARAAGRLAAEAGAVDVAVGCAGFMLDRTAVDFFTLGFGNFTLQQAAPRRYVRFTQVVAGLRDGFADRSRTLRRFHALGLGAAVMFPVLGAAAPAATELTSDATSPIHDAVRDGVLYDPVAHGARLAIERIVARILADEPWPFRCPFCTQFRTQNGHDPARAKAAWQAAGEPAIERPFIETDSELAAALPLFAGPDIGRPAQRTHVAHNHWVLGELARDMPPGDDREAWARERMAALTAETSLATSRGLAAAAEILDALTGGR